MISTEQTDILRAAVNRIIPPDDFPAGWEAGVADYLFGQFQRDLKDVLPIYRAGLDGLDAEARAHEGVPFAQAESSKQDALLTRIEQGQVLTPWAVDPVAFFQMLVEHSMEGYYSDPANGGNHNTISWQMIGFEVRG